ncbi:MAG: hypothetical protein AAF196_02020 [Planctomycetota bacterium]
MTNARSLALAFSLAALGLHAPISAQEPGDRTHTAACLSRFDPWLVAHQDEDGKWDADDFGKHDEDEPSAGPGRADQDVLVTSAALLALVADGSTHRNGPFKDSVRRGLRWLRTQQDPETGIVGVSRQAAEEREAEADPYTESELLSHVIATLALVEATSLSDSTLLAPNATAAVAAMETHSGLPTSLESFAEAPSALRTTRIGFEVMALGATLTHEHWANDARRIRERLSRFGDLLNPALERAASSDPDTAKTWNHLLASTLLAHNLAITAGNEDLEPSFGAEPPSTDASEELIEARRAARSLLLRDCLPSPQSDDEETTNAEVDHASNPSLILHSAYALHRGTPRERLTLERSLEPIVGAQRSNGEFDPTGPLRALGGRVYSAAILGTTLTFYYRYSRIAH